MGGAMEFLQMCGWVSVIAYCLNTLGLVSVDSLRARFDSGYQPPAAAESSPLPSTAAGSDRNGEISGIEEKPSPEQESGQ